MRYIAKSNIVSFGPHVIGPDGERLTLADLPPSDTGRWMPRRKAQLIAAIRGGLLTIAQASARYRLSAEEFLEWERHYDEGGLYSLRASVRLRPPVSAACPELPLP